MSNYLSEFASLVGKRQAQQVLKLINKQREQGQIQTLEEFNAKLESLLGDLMGKTIIPTLKLFGPKEDDYISEEQFNYKLERVEDDLTTSFEEANQISKVQEIHESIIRDLILKNLKAAIDELESKITTFEILNRDTRGFDSVLFSTFKETKEQRINSTNQYNIAFLDPRTLDIYGPTYRADVDLIGERLLLGTNEKDYYSIASIKQIFDSDFPQSSLRVEPPKVKLSNLIDNTVGTYWIQSLLFTTKREYARVKLELDLGAVKEVNFLEIEPAVIHPLELEYIYYSDVTGITRLAASPMLTFDGKISIVLPKIAAKKIVLQFKTENYKPIQFQYTSEDTLLHQAETLGSVPLPPGVNRVAQDLDEIISSASVKDIIGVLPEDKTTFGGYEFVVGFDNIRVGFSTYDQTSVYVSTPLEVSLPSRVGLMTEESRPYRDSVTLVNNEVAYTSTTYGASGDLPSKRFLGSTEFWVAQQNLDEDGLVISSNFLPLLPVGIERILQERLYLTEKSTVADKYKNVGRTMFFTDAADSTVIVYRNGEALASGAWSWVTTAADKTPNNKFPMVSKIRVDGVLPGDIYTVSYEPIYSTTIALPADIANPQPFTGTSGLQVIDLTGDLSARLQEENVITLDQIGKASKAIKSRLFLMIILRQNSADSYVSPYVEEYTLLAGNKTDSKLEV